MQTHSLGLNLVSIMQHNRAHLDKQHLRHMQVVHSTTAWPGQRANTLEQQLWQDNNSQNQPGFNTASSCDRPTFFVPELVASSDFYQFDLSPEQISLQLTAVC